MCDCHQQLDLNFSAKQWQCSHFPLLSVAVVLAQFLFAAMRISRIVRQQRGKISRKRFEGRPKGVQKDAQDKHEPG